MPNGTMLEKLDISRLSSLGWRSKISFSKGLPEVVGNYSNKNKR